jgi:hypothetical protein
MSEEKSQMLKEFWTEMYMQVPKEELIKNFLIAQEALDMSIKLNARLMETISSHETYLCPECKKLHKAEKSPTKKQG